MGHPDHTKQMTVFTGREQLLSTPRPRPPIKKAYSDQVAPAVNLSGQETLLNIHSLGVSLYEEQ